MLQKNDNQPKRSPDRRNENNQPDLTQPETDLEIDERLANIFNRLDRNRNGRIDIQDLTSALKGVGMSQQYAEVKEVKLSHDYLKIQQYRSHK